MRDTPLTDPDGTPVALVNLRSELRSADERLQAAERSRNDVLRRMTTFCPFKVGEVVNVKDVPGEWTITNITTSQDGLGWLITGEMVRRHKGGERSRTGRTFDCTAGSTHITKVNKPDKLV